MKYLGKFRNQTEMQKHFSRILHSYPLGSRLSPEDQADVIALLQRRPNAKEKIGCGVAFITVEPTRDRGFCVHRIDGTTGIFSYRRCISGLPATPRANVVKALRGAIAPQIIAARDATPTVGGFANCPATGVRFLASTGHVDHAPPWTFARITDAFMATRDIGGIRVVADPLNPYVPKIDDPKLVAEFCTFHRDRAVLRLVDSGFNMRVGGHASATCFDGECRR